LPWCRIAIQNFSVLKALPPLHLNYFLILPYKKETSKISAQASAKPIFPFAEAGANQCENKFTRHNFFKSIFSDLLFN